MIIESEDRVLMLGESKSGKTYLEYILARRFKRIIVITPYTDEWQDFKNVTYTVSSDVAFRTMKKAIASKNLLLVVDDADLYLSPYVLEDESIKALAVGSRHYGITTIFASRRTQDIPKLLLVQSNKIIIFQTDNKRGLDIIADNYGEEMAEIVKNLDRKKHEFLYLDRDERTYEVLVA